MYRFKALMGPCLWTRRTDTQATDVAVRVGMLDRTAEFARPESLHVT